MFGNDLTPNRTGVLLESESHPTLEADAYQRYQVFLLMNWAWVSVVEFLDAQNRKSKGIS
jgi:hypothetical protein